MYYMYMEKQHTRIVTVYKSTNYIVEYFIILIKLGRYG